MEDMRLVIAAFVLAALVAITSLGGILIPGMYAAETENWAAQSVGQDWFDLLVLVPVLASCGVGMLYGSRRAVVMFGGALVFTVYTFVLYAFAVHFNPLFLVYCATLGIGVFALVGVTSTLARRRVTEWYAAPIPARFIGGYLFATGAAFALLWLAEIVPALRRGTPPPGLLETGHMTNPVHVLDLSIVLPLLMVAGRALARRRPLGYVLGPMLLGFTTLMSLSLAALFVVMDQRGVPTQPALAWVFAALGLANAAMLTRVLASVRGA
jgi:hypothetical protein